MKSFFPKPVEINHFISIIFFNFTQIQILESFSCFNLSRDTEINKEIINLALQFIEELNISKLELNLVCIFVLMLWTFRMYAIMALHNFLLFIIYELPWLLRKDSGIISHCFLHIFELEVILLLHWLLLKATEPCLPYYLTNSWWRGEDSQ